MKLHFCLDRQNFHQFDKCSISIQYSSENEFRTKFLEQGRHTICLLRLCVCPSVCPVWNQNFSVRTFGSTFLVLYIYCSSKRDAGKERKILVRQFNQFANRAYQVIRSNQNYECMIWYCKFDIYWLLHLYWLGWKKELLHFTSLLLTRLKISVTFTNILNFILRKKADFNKVFLILIILKTSHITFPSKRIKT